NAEFVICHMAEHKKVRNVRRDARIALSLLGDKTNAKGLREYVVIYGNARVTEGGAADLLQRLARIYLGPNAVYPPPAMRNIPGYITRITPSHFAGVGPWNAQGSTVAATRSIASRARSSLLTLTFDISQLPGP